MNTADSRPFASDSYVNITNINHCSVYRKLLFFLFVLKRYLELDDQIEQERRAVKGREKERERRARDLEKKAREQADQCEYLNADYDRNVIVIIIFYYYYYNFFYLSSENMSRFWLHGSLFSVVLCSGGPGGATGQSEQRAQHAEIHSQQGRIQAPQHKK